MDYRASSMAEEALDLRIHSRRFDYEDEEPLDLSDTSASPELEIVFTPVPVAEEMQDDGDLVIVEMETAVCQVDEDVDEDPLHIDTDEDSLLRNLHTMTDSDAQQKQTRTGRATVKHYPAVDRLIKSSRLMCFLCDQKAKNGKTLETHIQKSHNIVTAQGRFLCCTECGFKCEFVDQLKDHFQAHHGDSKPGDSKTKAYYPCTHCSRMYRKQSLLDAHMRLVNQKDNWRKIKKAS